MEPKLRIPGLKQGWDGTTAFALGTEKVAETTWPIIITASSSKSSRSSACSALGIYSEPGQPASAVHSRHLLAPVSSMGGHHESKQQLCLATDRCHVTGCWNEAKRQELHLGIHPAFQKHSGIPRDLCLFSDIKIPFMSSL